MLLRLGSSADYSRTEGGSVRTQLGPRETAFVAGLDSFYVAAFGEDRWPYTQRHCGPKGFLRTLDTTILGFASSSGNRRYISTGNALLFLIDHGSRTRLKIWADAEVSEDPATIEKLAITGRSPAENAAFLFLVRAFDWCDKQHIKQRSVREVHSLEPGRLGKAEPVSMDAVTAKRWLSLDASSGIWTLNAYNSYPKQRGQALC